MTKWKIYHRMETESTFELQSLSADQRQIINPKTLNPKPQTPNDFLLTKSRGAQQLKTNTATDVPMPKAYLWGLPTYYESA